MTPERSEELQDTLAQMRRVSTAFYVGARSLGCHPFIEFTGLINEYILICQYALDQGIDFTAAHEHSGVALPLLTFHVEYIAEKFACIFGPSFRAREDTVRIFQREVWDRR